MHPTIEFPPSIKCLLCHAGPAHAFEDGQRFRVLCIVDDCTGEALATVVDRALSGARMTRVLDDLIRKRGQPDMIVSDNGTEMTSHAVPGHLR